MDWGLLIGIAGALAVVAAIAFKVYSAVYAVADMPRVEALVHEARGYLLDFGRRQQFTLMNERDLGALQYGRSSSFYSVSSGYLRAIMWRRMRGALVAGPWFVDILVRPGQWVEEGSELMRLIRIEDIDDDLHQQIEECFPLARSRHETRDVSMVLEDLTTRVQSAIEADPQNPIAQEALEGICEVLMEAITVPLGRVVAHMKRGGIVRVHLISFEQLLDASLARLLPLVRGHQVLEAEVRGILEELSERATETKNTHATQAIERLIVRLKEIAA